MTRRIVHSISKYHGEVIRFTITKKLDVKMFSQPFIFLIMLSFKVIITNGKNEEFCKFERYFEIDDSLNGLEQDDPVVIEAIKQKLISPPSSNTPYNFTR
jgi:hypothetical protein